MSNFISFIEEKFNNINFNTEIASIQKEAYQRFCEIGIPTKKHEDWKYLNLAFLSKLNFDNSKLSNEISNEQIQNLLIPNIKENLIVLVNGNFEPKHSRIIDNNLIIENIKNELPNDEVTKILNENLKSKHPFSLLNTAFIENGIYIRISESSEIKLPIHILNVFNNQSDTAYVNTKNIIISEKFSNCKVIQSYHNIGASDYILNTCTDFQVNENACLFHYNFQNDDENSVIFSYNQCNQQKSSFFSDNTITLNGKVVRNDLRTNLLGENIESYYNGLYLIDGKSIVDNHTIFNHLAPHCHSNEFYKGIIDDNAKAIFNGRVYVDQIAQKTDAYQQNRNLVISDNAAIYTKPELEIYADDVKCSHGATTGKIDENQMFYLMQRGISKPKARSLLMYTFCAEIISRIEVPEMKSYIEELVIKRLKADLEKIEV